MTAPTNDGVEARLSELFEAQARAVPVSSPRWSDVPLATVASLDAQRKRRRTRVMFGGGVAIAAAIALVIGLLSLSRGEQRVEVKPPIAKAPEAPTPVHFETHQVKLDADDIYIDANGKRFTAAGADVSVDSDPGGPEYWTSESAWQEHAVEMRLYIYFASDGRDWWATEIRTYNGKREADWIEYTGEFFKSPLGQPFVGDLDLTDPATGSALHMHGLRIATNPAKLDCTVGSGTFAIVSSFEEPTIEMPPGNSLSGVEVWLVDRTECANAPDQARYTFTWSSANPGIATVEPYGWCDAYDGRQPRACERGGLPLWSFKKAGQTTFHVVAKDSTTGAVVGERDFAVNTR
jgi:hypothetical protein